MQRVSMRYLFKILIIAAGVWLGSLITANTAKSRVKLQKAPAAITVLLQQESSFKAAQMANLTTGLLLLDDDETLTFLPVLVK